MGTLLTRVPCYKIGQGRLPRSTVVIVVTYKSNYRSTPTNCRLNIAHHRVHKIYTELKKPLLDDLPNASAVIFRVFVELSLDTYLEEKMSWVEQQIQNSHLAQKLNAVATDLENNGVMTQNELAPVRRAAGGQTLLAASIRTMHGYVHNRHFTPIPSDLKIGWDELQLFMEKVWA